MGSVDNTSRAEKYGPEVQFVTTDTPLEDIYYLIKRDGAVFVKNFVSAEDVDQASADAQQGLDEAPEWHGDFYPKTTSRATAMIARSETFTKTQVMNPMYQAVCDHFLTTRSWNWWGTEWKETVSKPYVTSCTALRIGPGAPAQPLHRDDYINHNFLEELEEWHDEPYKRRESSVGLMVAAAKVTRANGGTQFIPRSHLWGTRRKTPPNVDDCIHSELEKGDALIMLASLVHGGGCNSTQDDYRLMFATFSTRGHLRQEENQYLSVPPEVIKKYDRETQKYIGYSISEPACGYVNEVDPIYTLYPEELKNVKIGF